MLAITILDKPLSTTFYFLESHQDSFFHTMTFPIKLKLDNHCAPFPVQHPPLRPPHTEPMGGHHCHFLPVTATVPGEGPSGDRLPPPSPSPSPPPWAHCISLTHGAGWARLAVTAWCRRHLGQYLVLRMDMDA